MVCLPYCLDPALTALSEQIITSHGNCHYDHHAQRQGIAQVDIMQHIALDLRADQDCNQVDQSAGQ